ERLKAAKYSVIAWTGSALDFPHSELTIQNITGLVEKLNQTTRSSGLPMGGNEGDVGAYNTSSWISGYPFRSSYRRNFPDYEPYLYTTERMLAEQEADALFWINSYAPDRLAPAHQAASVVIGHPDMKLEHEPDVFIPVATPGIDCKGTQFRSDSSVSLPLQQLRATTLPTLGEVLSAIEAAL
ncbi:MAG: formylmethanofuran dehydrogenase subunit B, partial [Methylophilaceae bacterium]